MLVPKARFPVFQWKEVKEIAESPFDWICDRHNIDLFTKEIKPDYVHLFISCSPEIPKEQKELLAYIRGESKI